MRQDLRIVVEGMDGAGKTTLISRLMYDFENLDLIRNPNQDRQDFEKWWPEQLDRQKSDQVPIHDRFVFSEIVYGPVIRKKINVGEILLNNAVLFLRHTALLVYARPHSDILRQTVMSSAHMAGVQEHFQELLELYDKIMMVEREWFKDRFVRYDWNGQLGYEEVRKRVELYLEGKLP